MVTDYFATGTAFGVMDVNRARPLTTPKAEGRPDVPRDHQKITIFSERQ